MEKLWAPWRMEYIRQESDENGESRDKTCIFCDFPSQNTDDKNLILARYQYCYIIMNRYPYNNGHLMIVPYDHLSEMIDIDKACWSEMGRAIQMAQDALFKTMKPHGYNVGMNLGKVAGAGIDQHLHIHIVPRWNGDTNFMPVLGSTKVISEALDKTYYLLKPHLERDWENSTI